MKKIVLLTLFVLFALPMAKADEGMWLPSLIGKERIKDMQAKGLKLSANDLYDINNACLKDAIVRFGGGCTGEMISSEGLLLTNHHCGYRQIQSHSSLENDYLTDGFVARSKKEELSNPGLKVDFLKEMRDVTSEIMSAKNPKAAKKIREKLIKEATKNGVGLKANIESLYYGNEYYMFVYQEFTDVRLVFAPASSIGKFGGDTDNWMWPRHTGDFSIFRVYADANNEPAEYSADNKPFTPKKHFKLSAKGIKEGDFTFVYGFPGRTQQYIHSEAVKYIEEISNPLKIELRTRRLEIMNSAQDADALVRIKYSAKNASVSNAWKKWQGETLGLNRLKTVETKQTLELQFKTWAQDKPQYQGVVEDLETLYDSLERYALAKDIFVEAPLSIELVKFALSYTKDGQKVSPAFYKDYVKQIDSTTAHYLVEKFIEYTPKEFVPVGFTMDSVDKVVAEMFTKSIFLDSAKLHSATKEQVDADVTTRFAKAIVGAYVKVLPEFGTYNDEITELYKTYMQGLMEMQPERNFFPDANSTLRIAYGKVGGYEPRDAVYYTPVSTLDGVMQKDNPKIYDYDVPESLREIYRNKDFGRWEVDGTVPVCFIATNHTTGGNSGSPVLNANGELIGINFDRVWEGTMSDIQFDPEVCRNIALDIRYVLFIVDKLYGASYLVEEMDVVY